MENETLNSSLSKSEQLKEAAALKKIWVAQGINVWSENQEVLEEQALQELEKFAEQQNEQNDALEEGEIIDNFHKDVGENVKKPEVTILNIDSYINKQAELKKRYEFKKSLEISDHSKALATKIASKTSDKFYIHHKNKKVKRSASKVHPSEKRSEDCIEPLNGVHDQLKTDVVSNTISDEVNNESNEDKSGSEYIPSDGELDSDYEHDYATTSVDRVQKVTKRRRRSSKSEHIEKVKDDGLLQCYRSRLDLHYNKLEEELSLKSLNKDEEQEDIEYFPIKRGLKVPIKLWNNLYSYQQDGIKWLWKIHQESTGGLLGDEMGLGKTVQIIVFFQSLECSRIVSCHGRFNGLGPSLIVCPATVIHQWVKHFHDWAPEFRVGVLHQSGSYQGRKADLIKEMHKNKGIIVTTYLGILKFKGNLLDYTWHYIVLDEGHKIRNPTAKVTVALKQFRTPYRIMLTGSPMQNNLTELWSLFDFTNPGMLGNLTTFQEHFATPIIHGGFSNSTPMQEATALSVATTLKNIITPYLLRRSKNEVQHDILLPNKSEQVLFCSLTNEQKDLYKGYLMSEHVNMILGRGTKNWFSENHMRANVLVAITTLRKICNHPDIYMCEADEGNMKNDEATPVEERFGYYKRSGKMIVVSALLKIWKKQAHRVLLFTQGRSMISIFQDFLEEQRYKYLKMDGSTSISSRQSLIDKFNQDETYDVFLLTTRVGGLGINLTGADRVIIFDPDWNPATDTQARERAWRIGQERQVTIYRLLTAGTIEEKMYQRQVWKQLLSNKVLLDPRTNRFFKTSDLHDLFSLQETMDSNPETANIFHDSRVRIQENIRRKSKEKSNKKKRKSETSTAETTSSEVQFTEDKILAMKNLAQQIAKSLSQAKEQPQGTKTSHQLELEEERLRKLKEKEQLKKLTPQQLLTYNKEKANRKEDDSINKIDDCETDASFEKALGYSEETAKLHHILNSGTIKDPDVIMKKAVNIRQAVVKVKEDEKIKIDGVDSSCNDNNPCGSDAVHEKQKKKKKHRGKPIIDNSGTLDGEKIEGLVKSELKKSKKEKKRRTDVNHSQDSFVLGKLFSKKGVFGALQHDSVIQSGSQGTSLKIHTEAKMRAEKSLEALRKSRINNWRW